MLLDYPKILTNWNRKVGWVETNQIQAVKAVKLICIAGLLVDMSFSALGSLFCSFMKSMMFRFSLGPLYS